MTDLAETWNSLFEKILFLVFKNAILWDFHRKRSRREDILFS